MEAQTTTHEGINFVNLLERLFGVLSDRERDVLQRRHALTPNAAKKQTLEKIGADYKVTRERIRQIERDGVKKLREKMANHETAQEIAEVEKTIRHFLKKYGGVMEENHLLQSVIDFFSIPQHAATAAELQQHKKTLAFIISQLLADQFEQIGGTDDRHQAWQLKEAPAQLVEQVITLLVDLIEKKGAPLKADELFSSVRNHTLYQELGSQLSQLSAAEQQLVDLDEAILAYLKTSKKIKQNLFGHIGLSQWSTISPKRMTDKIYLIMQQHGKPLHFTEIANLINEAGFDHKKALSATVHNELILDKRYVLIGRGIYALREWGYQPGTVSDVIQALLKSKGPLTKDDIIGQVSTQRLVKKATINLALMNKDLFRRLPDKRYALTENSQQPQ